MSENQPNHNAVQIPRQHVADCPCREATAIRGICEAIRFAAAAGMIDDIVRYNAMIVLNAAWADDLPLDGSKYIMSELRKHDPLAADMIAAIVGTIMHGKPGLPNFALRAAAATMIKAGWNGAPFTVDITIDDSQPTSFEARHVAPGG